MVTVSKRPGIARPFLLRLIQSPRALALSCARWNALWTNHARRMARSGRTPARYKKLVSPSRETSLSRICPVLAPCPNPPGPNFTTRAEWRALSGARKPRHNRPVFSHRRNFSFPAEVDRLVPAACAGVAARGPLCTSKKTLAPPTQSILWIRLLRRGREECAQLRVSPPRCVNQFVIFFLGFAGPTIDPMARQPSEMQVASANDCHADQRPSHPTKTEGREHSGHSESETAPLSALAAMSPYVPRKAQRGYCQPQGSSSLRRRQTRVYRFSSIHQVLMAARTPG